MDSHQGEADIFEHATDNVVHNELDQDPLDPFQGATGDHDPIAHQTRGRLQHQHYTANEAIDGTDLGE